MREIGNFSYFSNISFTRFVFFSSSSLVCLFCIFYFICCFFVFVTVTFVSLHSVICFMFRMSLHAWFWRRFKEKMSVPLVSFPFAFFCWCFMFIVILFCCCCNTIVLFLTPSYVYFLLELFVSFLFRIAVNFSTCWHVCAQSSNIQSPHTVPHLLMISHCNNFEWHVKTVCVCVFSKKNNMQFARSGITFLCLFVFFFRFLKLVEERDVVNINTLYASCRKAIQNTCECLTLFYNTNLLFYVVSIRAAVRFFHIFLFLSLSRHTLLFSQFFYVCFFHFLIYFQEMWHDMKTEILDDLLDSTRSMMWWHQRQQ